MPSSKRRASNRLNRYGAAQCELIGKTVVLTDGKAGTVENVWLDELHGLRISIRGHDGKWPISTIKFAQLDRNHRQDCSWRWISVRVASESPELTGSLCRADRANRRAVRLRRRLA